MSSLPQPKLPPVDFGLIAASLGIVAMLLFFLPVLSIPLAAIGLLLALGESARLVRRPQAHWMWAAWGLALSGFALAMAVTIGRAPTGSNRQPDSVILPIRSRPSVPPPATLTRQALSAAEHDRTPLLMDAAAVDWDESYSQEL